MKLMTGVMYDDRPEDVVVYPTSVMVTKSCEEVQMEDETSGTTSTKFKCDIEVYDVNEYIILMQANAVTWDELAVALQEGVDSV